MPETIHTQVAILGAGPGGYAAAFAASDHGLDTTLIDLEPNPGGVCLYRGCIPSKALLHIAKLIQEADEADHWGVHFNRPDIDLDRLRKSKDDVVRKMTGGLGQICKARKLPYIQGRGSFEDATTLRVIGDDGNEHRIHTQHTIIATGSRPTALPGLRIESDRILNSTSALELRDVPKTMLVIGGGYIGLELGSVYAALGSKVTVVEMTDGLLPGADRDLVRPLANRLENILDAIHLSTKVVDLSEEDEGIRATLISESGEESVELFDKVLVSIGRKPNSSGVGLANTQVQVDEQGFIRVDDQRRTNEPAIFAIGDIVGEPMLAHKATHEGRVVADVIAGNRVAFEPNAIPAVVFTDPEIAWCGLTETQAKAQGIKVDVSRFPWAASGRATTLNRNDGVTKLLTDPETNHVVGAGITGTGAGELIAEAVLAIEMGATAEDIGLTIHPHPTLSESLMEAADLVYGRATHIYRPKAARKNTPANS
jgi:dihydrolipoamide dehydrogenase